MYTQRYNQWEDFTKTVLEFSFTELNAPLRVAQRQPPLPVREENISLYYANFLPFILEEARAIIASGLEKVDLYLSAQAQRNRQRNANTQHLSDAKPFDLVLQKKAALPYTAGNPLFLNFKGAISDKIEHGKSMNAIILKIPATNSSPEKQWLALASENLEGTETYAKIIATPEDYAECQKHFKKGAKWQAHYLGSVISEQRMFDHYLMQIDSPCIQRIIRARVSPPNTQPNTFVNAEVAHLNQSQKEALYAFFNAPEGSVTLLQGPPGTGKTTTLVNLLKCVADQAKRILVSAHSNKGVQVLALRAYRELPHIPMILIGVESKVPDELRPIFLNRWYDNIQDSFSTHYKDSEKIVENSEARLDISKSQLLQNFVENLAVAKAALTQFNLLYFQRLETESRNDILRVCGNDPITMSDFEAIQSTIKALQRNQSDSDKWKELLAKQTRLMEKWARISKSSIEAYLLDYADIIFATLITCGRDSISNMLPVDYLLVDEAAQSVEAATMIPMRFQPKKVLLVGDTKQLPATVISDYLDDHPIGHPDTHYKWSLMWRLIEECNQPSLMLDIQYRMHPDICWWPSEKYYNNQLITAPDILPQAPLTTNGITSRPYAVYQVAGQETNQDFTHSLSNEIEANYVVAIIALIRQQNPDKSIGVITPYSAQKSLITQKIHQKRLRHDLVDVNTVDGFQGDERDVIIISFTRTHVSTFLKEFRRLNVAITRPKCCLIILANPGLTTHDIGELIRNAQKRQVIFSETELKTILQTKKLPAQREVSSASLSQQAWQRNAQAQYEYHLTLLSHNLHLALVWLRRAAENNHSIAQFNLSQYYQTGNQFLRKNIALSLKWLQKSAENNYQEAQYDLAKKFIQGGIIRINIESGIYWCKKAADNHQLDANIFLAKCYASGQHVNQHQATAIVYYRRAAGLNDIASMFELAKLLQANNNVVEAIQWYRTLSTQNYREAYYPLALLLDESVEALEYLEKAADDGHVEAQYKLLQVYTTGNRYAQVNLSKAAHYAKKLADTQHRSGLIALIELLQQHDAIEINEQERRRYYKIAADQGHIASQYFYALSIFQAQPSIAHGYFKKAVQAHYSDAYYYFALLEKQFSESNSYFYFKKSIELNKHINQSKTACIQYQIKHNVDLHLCLQFCEELQAEGEKSFDFILARFLDTGLAGKTDRQKALNMYSDLADSGHLTSSFYAGIILSNAAEAFLDLDRARIFFTQCHTSILDAKLRLACLLLKNSVDIDFAETLLGEYCSLSSGTQTELLSDLERQCEVIIKARNIQLVFTIETFKLYTPNIYFYLGKIVEEGLGATINLSAAFYYYEDAAKKNHLEGTYRLAHCYEYGIGTQKDWQRAKILYQKAADRGHELAQKRLTWQYSMLSSFTSVNDTQLKSKETCVIS